MSLTLVLHILIKISIRGEIVYSMNYFLIVMLFSYCIHTFICWCWILVNRNFYLFWYICTCLLSMVLKSTSSYSSADFSGLDCISLLDVGF